MTVPADVLRHVGLSPQRAKVLAFIRAEAAAGRGFPTRRAIRDHMGWAHVRSVGEVLHALAGSGHLTRRSVEGSFVFALPRLVLACGDPRHAAWLQHFRNEGCGTIAQEIARFRRPIETAADWPPATADLETMVYPGGRTVWFIPHGTPEWAAHVAALRREGRNGRARAQAMELSRGQIGPATRWPPIDNAGD